jgi:hypothetical protein
MASVGPAGLGRRSGLGHREIRGRVGCRSDGAGPCRLRRSLPDERICRRRVCHRFPCGGGPPRGQSASHDCDSHARGLPISGASFGCPVAPHPRDPPLRAKARTGRGREDVLVPASGIPDRPVGSGARERPSLQRGYPGVAVRSPRAPLHVDLHGSCCGRLGQPFGVGRGTRCSPLQGLVSRSWRPSGATRSSTRSSFASRPSSSSATPRNTSS